MTHGPAPTVDPRRAAGLGAPARRVLEAVSRNGPAGVDDLAAYLGLHRNTVREHLEALVERGLVEPSRGPARGRGRPRTLFVVPDRVGVGGAEALLVRVLVEEVAPSLDDPAELGRRAGRRWAAFLSPGGEPVADGPAPEALRRRTLDLLADAGFTVVPSDGYRRAEIVTCPVLAAARERPDLVCAVHAGAVAGTLERLGDVADAAAVRVVPFAGPGHCLLVLGADDEAAPPGEPDAGPGQSQPLRRNPR